MNIALPILLLVIGGLTFWLLVESSVKYYLKIASIASFCLFTVIFWGSIHSFLGWAALEDDMPDKVLIHWTIIKEPNKAINFDGRIYILLESAKSDDGTFLAKLFGYRKEKIEPRLFALEYSRSLHEQLEGIKGRLKKGQPVLGELEKGENKKGIGSEKNKGEGKGEGSESQEQDWEFHELQPSDIHVKDP